MYEKRFLMHGAVFLIYGPPTDWQKVIHILAPSGDSAGQIFLGHAPCVPNVRDAWTKKCRQNSMLAAITEKAAEEIAVRRTLGTCRAGNSGFLPISAVGCGCWRDYLMESFLMYDPSNWMNCSISITYGQTVIQTKEGTPGGAALAVH
jgi:hypothetical protein